MRNIFLVPKNVVPEVEELTAAIVSLAQKYDRETAFLAIQFAVSALWCNGDDFKTVTEAVDRWRQYAPCFEDMIRESFGEVRYRDVPTTEDH